MIEEFYDMFPSVPSERLYFRLTDAGGRSCNGGNSDPLPLNGWSPVIEDPRICVRGWHATRDPFAWKGQRVWVVEVSDTDGGIREDKVCASRLRPLCEVTSENTKNPRLLARIGVFTEGVELTPEDAYLVGYYFGPHDVTRSIACEDAKYAYFYALEVDRGPRDDTRRAASRDPQHAFHYALDVDKGPRDDTREAACKDEMCAYFYALDVDKGPRDDTRDAACQDPAYAFRYAFNVDKGPRDDTRTAACQDAMHAYMYARYVDEGPRDDTRKAACESAEHAYLYAVDVDKGPRPDTRKAACDPYWKMKYEESFPVTGS